MRPRLHLTASVVFSLSVLAYYKYAAFLVSAALPALSWFGRFDLPVPEILLPLGISFFTFQIIALAVDSYRGGLEPVKSFREYALFICFFPQLIAGPIVRGWQLLPQIRAGGEISWERNRRGLWLIALGLAKKVLVADLLLAPYVDRVFASPGFNTAPEHLVAVYSFAFQIYFDFSGYTDIARGLANLLGFDLPLNFREPYLSRDPAEFWRRWHMTLSRWLRDYLYIPLGGSRVSPLRTQRNLFLTMLLGGLWHGAGWNFIIWGGLHGVLLMAHRRLGRPEKVDDRPLGWRDLPRIVLLFHAVCVLWIFFRAATFGDAVAVLTRIGSGGYAEFWPAFQLGVVGFCAVFHVVERYARLHFDAFLARLEGLAGGVVEGVAFGVVAGLILLFGSTGGEFIYFQF